MSALMVFENDMFGAIRITDNQGAPWFIAVDVAKALGYKDPGDAVKTVCRKISKFHTQVAIKPYNIIPESDVYRLVMKSTLPSAEKFQDWVVEVVLPSIRKTGKYADTEASAPNNSGPTLVAVSSEFSAAKKLALEMGIEVVDAIMCAKNAVKKTIGVDVFQLMDFDPCRLNIPGELKYMTVTQLGMKYFDGMSPHKVNIMLKERGFQVKKGYSWFPTKEGAKYTASGTMDTGMGKKFTPQRLWSPVIVEALKAKAAA